MTKYPMPEHADLLSPAEAANLFGVHTKTLTSWARQGKVKTVRTLGGHRRYFREEIENLIKSNQTVRES